MSAHRGAVKNLIHETTDFYKYSQSSMLCHVAFFLFPGWFDAVDSMCPSACARDFNECVEYFECDGSSDA
jgi:hypothetical protein